MELMEQGLAAYTGQASFLGAHRVRVGELVLEADRILIAPGSRTTVRPIEWIEEVADVFGNG